MMCPFATPKVMSALFVSVPAVFLCLPFLKLTAKLSDPHAAEGVMIIQRRACSVSADKQMLPYTRRKRK